jgi:hypothetical protein
MLDPRSIPPIPGIPRLFNNEPPKTKWLQLDLKDELIYIRQQSDNTVAVVQFDANGMPEYYAEASSKYKN